jgi:DNA-directed RNA polymerase subunit RPC12/RpoP
MPTPANGYRDAPQFRPGPLACRRCGHDHHLEITSIDALPADSASRAALVEVSFRCIGCGTPFTQAADVTEVARILNRAGSTRNVLAFGGHYIHCGQPMRSAGAEVRSIHSTYNERRLPETLGVYLATRVLRCVCGFQMEIPDQSL